MLAPADEDAELPPYLTSCGRAVPVRYNGSVARLTFGPVTSARVTRWLESGGFDVVHLHEPVTPSVSLMALWAAEEPVVATFHTADGAVPGDARRQPTAAALAGEDPRPDRGVRGRGPHRPASPRRRDVHHPERRPRRPLRRRAGSGGVDRHRRRPDAGLPRSGRRAAQGPRGRAARPAHGPRRPPRRPAARRGAGRRQRAARARRPPCGRRDRRPRCGLRRRQGHAAALGRRVRRAAPRRRELRHRPRRGDGRRSAGRGLGPVGVRRGPRRRTHRGHRRDRRRRGARARPRRPPRATGPGGRRCGCSGRERARTFDWSRVSGQVMAVYETVLEGAHADLGDPAPRGLWGRFVRSVPGSGGS